MSSLLYLLVEQSEHVGTFGNESVFQIAFRRLVVGGIRGRRGGANRYRMRARRRRRLFKIKERTDGLDLKTALTGAGAQFNWILKTLLNILFTFLLSFTGCPTVLQDSIEFSIEFSISK